MFRYLRFYQKPLKGINSYNFCQILLKITRDDLQTKPHKKNILFVDPHNCLSGTATQIQLKSSQTGIEVIANHSDINTKLGMHVEDTTTCSHVQRQLHIFKND